MYLVIRFDENLGCNVAVNRDGTTSADPYYGELYQTQEQAAQVAEEYGGTVLPASRLFDASETDTELEH